MRSPPRSSPSEPPRPEGDHPTRTPTLARPPVPHCAHKLTTPDEVSRMVSATMPCYCRRSPAHRQSRRGEPGHVADVVPGELAAALRVEDVQDAGMVSSAQTAPPPQPLSGDRASALPTLPQIATSNVHPQQPARARRERGAVEVGEATETGAPGRRRQLAPTPRGSSRRVGRRHRSCRTTTRSECRSRLWNPGGYWLTRCVVKVSPAARSRSTSTFPNAVAGVRTPAAGGKRSRSSARDSALSPSITDVAA